MQDIAFLDQADGVMQKIMRGIWCFGAHNVCVALKQHRFLAFATILPIFPDDDIIYIIPPDTQTAFSGKGKLEISQAEELLQSQLAQESSARDISIESIQRTVASHFGVTMTDILSEKRNRGIAEPRMIAMFLCRELTKSSSNEVGSAFGRNHATVLHAEKKVPQLCEANEGVRRAISQIKRQLQRG